MSNQGISFLVGMAVGVFIMALVVDDKYKHHNTITKQGCAQYNPQTGDFEWLTKKTSLL